MGVINNNSQSVILIPNGSRADNEVNQLIIDLGYRNIAYSDFDTNNIKLRIVLVLRTTSEFCNDDISFVSKLIEARIPIIVAYPEAHQLEDIHNDFGFTEEIISLWGKIPVFRDERQEIPVVHIPISLLSKVLNYKNFRVGSNIMPSDYYVIKKNDVENG